MFVHNLNIIIRNLRKNLGYSIINIFGLGIGIAASFVILIYVQHETSHEQHFPNRDQTYRIGTKFMSMGSFANGPEILLSTISEELSCIKKATKLSGTGELTLKILGLEMKESGLYVDSSFFEIFHHEFLQGNREQSLQVNNSIVISEKLSTALFGSISSLGRIIEIVNKEEDVQPIVYQVSGVVDELT